MSSQPVTRVTPEEYLERERAAESKSEYIFGEIVAMARGMPRHSLIVNNIQFSLTGRLLPKGCLVFNADLRVSVRWGDLITYPDVTVLCGRPEYVDEKQDTLTNPALVVEVLSESTKTFDRGEKSRLYRMVPSLQEYLLIDQTPVDVEHWRRLPNGNWELATIREESAILHLSIGCELPVAEVYRNIERLGQ